MAEPISQAGRLLSLKTPLGEDVLCMDRANITEQLAKPFAMQFDLLADLEKASSVKYDKLLGNNVTLTVLLPDDQKRYFCGMVSRFTATGRDVRFAHYRMEVVPWLWLLSLSTDCKVFQDKTVPEIIEEVFKDWQGKYASVVKFENKLSGSFTKLDYCVQYRETDFNFISRLMEQEGIFYYFEHAEDKHTLVLTNDFSSLPSCPNLEKAPYLPETGDDDGVLSWEYRHSIVPGKVNLGDYHFQMSNKSIRRTSDGSVKVAGNDNLEVFDYPGDYGHRFNKPDERLGDVESHGDDIAKWRMEEQAAAHLVVSGTSTCRAFGTGHCFQLIGKNEAPINEPAPGKYVLASVSHSIQQDPHYVSNEGLQEPYRNMFSCIPQQVKYRPSRETARPVVQGVQTAVVVGLQGEEIDCDKYGRVKVQFHWDREGKKNEKSSCWVRVATLLGGKQWGMIHIPRIGQEVIVAFLEGDPDQPLIVGSVYNYDNMPPYTLPDNKTQSGIKTRSTKDGTDENFNEICFEDKKGEELLYVRAEKNLTKAVENDETIWVGNDRWTEVDNQETVTVDKGDRTITLNQGNDKHQIKMGNRDVLVDMGNDTTKISQGNQSTKLDLGKAQTEAMQSIEFTVGQNSIKIDQTGITIKGMMVSIEGQATTDVKSPMTTVKGDGMLTLKGGLTMIN
jgi:type VI secretion system secreted protein VgrG